MLGLGDIVVPGVMAALARKIDVEGLSSSSFTVPTISEMTSTASPAKAGIVWPNFYTTQDYIKELFRKKEVEKEVVEKPIPIEVKRKLQGKVSYLKCVTVGYTTGLLGAFAANEITHSGQPALLYLVPTVILSMLYGAVKNGELRDLWGDGLSFSSKDDPPQ